MTLVVALRINGCKSRGTVKSKSTNPAAAPPIDPNFLTEDEHMDQMVATKRRIRHVCQPESPHLR
jgi:hypothetical protein